jgi:hypothetical protein
MPESIAELNYIVTDEGRQYFPTVVAEPIGGTGKHGSSLSQLMIQRLF